MTAASSGRVARISERSSGISPAATRGFIGEYLGRDVVEVVDTGEHDTGATDTEDIDKDEDTKEVTGGLEDSVEITTDPEEITVGTEDSIEEVVGFEETVLTVETEDTVEITGEDVGIKSAAFSSDVSADTGECADGITAGNVTVENEEVINESELDDKSVDSVIFGLSLLLLRGEQDRELGSELDGTSLMALDEPASTEEEDDLTPWTADGVILYFAMASGLNG